MSADFSLYGKTIFKSGFEHIYDIEGKINRRDFFEKGTILVDGRLADDMALQGEMRMTCAHELFHWLLHREYFKGKGEYNRRIEWQAEYAAGAILIPAKTLITLHHQYSSKYDEAYICIHKIAKDLAAPPEIVARRLKEKGLIGTHEF